MLTKSAIARLETRDRDYVVYDSPNLYLRVYRTGRKAWIFRRREMGHDRQLTLGEWPDVGLVEARYRRDEALRSGRRLSGLTMQELIDKWLVDRRDGRVSVGTRYHDALEVNRMSHLLSRGIRTITRPELIAYLRHVADTVSIDAAYRSASTLKMIFDYGADVGEVDEPHVATSLSRGLPVHPGKVNYRSIHDPVEIGRLLRALDYAEDKYVRAGLKIVSYVFTRASETQMTRWRDIDFDNALWTVPAENTKKRRDLLVPLPRQCVEILTNLDHKDEPNRAVFAHLHGTRLLNGLYRLQRLPDELRPQPMTVHGFRSMASTILNEHGWPSDAIERQLAHVSGGVRAVYNKAQYLDKRREMLQWYADYLDRLRDTPQDARE